MSATEVTKATTTATTNDEYEKFKTLLNTTIEYEKQLKELRSGNPKENAAAISDLLNTIRTNYHQLILHYPQFCSPLSKDIDSLLWKSCFYKQIDEYRKSIKRTVDIIDNKDDKIDKDLAEKAKLHLFKLTTAYNKFLASSIIFYQDLMLQLENLYENNNINNDKNGVILKFIHRCLLYLGDLLRYQEISSENKEKDFTEAENYYKRAAFLLPTSGNPHNQLAALSSYMDISCVAIYHSCRSLLVKLPFDTAIENIKLFFEKNSRSYANLDRDQISRNDNNDKSKKAAKVKQFFIMFLRMHGMLFEWTQTTLELLKGASIDINTPNVTQLRMEKTVALLDTVMEEFDALLNANCFGEQILIKILIICIFSLHRGADVSNVIREKLYGNEREYKPFRSVSESFALTIIFHLVTKTASRISKQSNEKDRSKKPSSAISKSLPFISVFAEWAGIHSHYLIAVEPHHLQDISILEKSLVADKELLQLENRSRSGMRLTMTSLEEFATLNQKNSSLQKDLYNKPLREHIELRGFLPLERLYENYFSDLKPMSNVKPLPDELSYECRSRTIQLFLQHSLKPSAPQESNDATNKNTKVEGTNGKKGGLLAISATTISAVMKEHSKTVMKEHSKNNKSEKGRKKKSKGRDNNEINSKRRASMSQQDRLDYSRDLENVKIDQGINDMNDNNSEVEDEDDEEDEDNDNDGDETDDGADMSEQVADILMVQPLIRPSAYESNTSFFSSLGLMGSNSHNDFMTPTHNFQLRTQDMYSSKANSIDANDDDVDDVVVFKPAFSRNAVASNNGAEPFVPFSTNHYHSFSSNGSLHDKWNSNNDELLDWANETDLLNAGITGILDDNENDIHIPFAPPPGLGYNT